MTSVNSFSQIVYILFLISFNSVIMLTESRHRHGNHANSNHTAEQLLLAKELSSRMTELQNNWSCSIPKARLVYIIEENPLRITSNTQWIPPAAVLHRCEHHTGCCWNHPADTCKPIQTEHVSILFKQVNVLNGDQTYERLTFTNHTECGCQGLGEVLTALPTTTTSTESSTNTSTS